MIYLDTSAMVKLVVQEPESTALIDWLNARAEQPLATSVIGRIELIRAAARLGAATSAAADGLAAMVDVFVLTEAIAARASTLSPTELRTLDAIHLATAHIHRETLTDFCAYDRRLLAAAREQQLPVVAPGGQ